MSVKILTGDCRDVLRTLPDGSVHCCVTSPPYFGLRDYGHADQIGLEPTPDEFVSQMVAVFREVRRVLRDDGTLWLNLGDSYAGGARGGYPGGKSGLDGSAVGQNITRLAGTLQTRGKRPHEGLKSKDLIGIPWMVAFALRADGWYLRKDIIWHKPNAMPESVQDRPTSAHEHVFLLSKTDRYWYDADAIREPESVPDWDDGTRVFGGVNKHGANLAHGDHTTGRVATARIAKNSFRREGSKRAQAIPGHTVGTHRPDRTDTLPNPRGRNARDVWSIPTRPFAQAHFATFPPDLAERCIKAGCPTGGTVLDPFGGAGTTGLVADRLGRDALLIELNPEYVAMAADRIRADAPLTSEVAA